METRNDETARGKVLDMISSIKVALMVTTANGSLHARPMVAQQEHSDGELWFFTSASSRKIGEIAADPQVLLSYADPDSQDYVSVVGDAEVVRDRGKIHEKWSEPMRVWFPKGKDDPDIALIRVRIREAEYWDSASSTLVHAYGYAKAVLTGERPNPGDNKHVDFDQARH